jgi:hypothetical protein
VIDVMADSDRGIHVACRVELQSIEFEILVHSRDLVMDHVANFTARWRT